MTTLQKITLRISEIRRELHTLSEADELTPEQRESISTLRTEASDLELKRQAAIEAEGNVEPEPVEGDNLDAETRERIQLRKKTTIAGILAGYQRGRQSTEIAEYQAACKVAEYDIPFDLWEPEQRDPEQRAVTGAPTVTGVNPRALIPAVFSKSAAAKLQISMPQVESGTVVWPKFNANLTAGFVGAGDAQAATAATFTTVSGNPHRLSARLEVGAEVLASVGIPSFEGALRQNLSDVMSNVLDRALLSGDGAGNNISGLITTKGTPTAEATTSTFSTVLTKMAGTVDGIFAENLKAVNVLVGVATYRKFIELFPATTLATHPRESINEYLMRTCGMVASSANMPAAASNVQTAIVAKTSYSGEKAVVATWGAFSIDDQYSGAAKAERSFTMHMLISDVRLLQDNAYQMLSFKLA